MVDKKGKKVVVASERRGKVNEVEGIIVKRTAFGKDSGGGGKAFRERKKNVKRKRVVLCQDVGKMG